ncbi:hypothetical protein HRG_001528 [Hirsutella rhossiliensis]|uniref:DNA helicase Pif1-like 2B domain-containing protein n=1 Tax=Hirsutella rhossiliensis TaxID=111463 RepID=A0A9P8SQ61_9HYPO|nr:uncharacterized protein HRG_01528 [Hirsutella rhossiliensis]KAH0968886.1 hypothetical protein HRG_01528 [Hirsutella rhossiliensis]
MLGAAAAPDDKAGNLAKQVPVCIGARLMLTSNLWQQVGLCNGARGAVYHIAWAPGADPIQDQPVQPCVIMMEFDKYSGPVLLTTADGRKSIPARNSKSEFGAGRQQRSLEHAQYSKNSVPSLYYVFLCRLSLQTTLIKWAALILVTN